MALKMSPTAESPASIPVRWGCTLPCTTPHTPGTRFTAGAIPIMQVEVPTTLTTSSVRQPAPIASQCASNAPTGMGMPGLSPSSAAQCAESRPAIWSEVAYSPPSFSRTPDNNGSTLTRNSSGGRPPSFGFQSHLWPMAHTLRFTRLGSVMPQSVAAIMSQCSKAETNSERFSGLCRNQCRSFEKPHSDEYTPPHHWIPPTPLPGAPPPLSPPPHPPGLQPRGAPHPLPLRAVIPKKIISPRRLHFFPAGEGLGAIQWCGGVY